MATFNDVYEHYLDFDYLENSGLGEYAKRQILMVWLDESPRAEQEIISHYIIQHYASEFDDRTKFEKWLGDKFGPALAKTAIALFGAAALNDLFNGKNPDSKTGGPAVVTPIVNNDGSSIIGDSQSVNVNSGWSNLFQGIGNIASSLGSSLGGLIGQFGSSWFNKQNMKELIDYQNEYNTPANQMQRFADAGLNPNLIYGLGSNGNQPASGSIAPVDFDTSQRENRMAKFQMSMQGAQVKADIAEKQSATNLNNQNASLAADNAEYQKLVNTTYMQQFEANLQQTIATTDNLIAQKRSILADIEQKIQSTHESNAREQLLIAQRETENALRDAQKQKIQAETALAQFNAHSGPFKIALDIGKVDGDNVGSTLYDNTPELFKRGYRDLWKLGKRINKNKTGSKF